MPDGTTEVATRPDGPPSTSHRLSSPDASGEDLLNAALSDPEQALRSAEELLAGSSPDPLLASSAHQAIGVVLRDRGDHHQAIQHLRKAVALARRSGDEQRLADVSATLGAALVLAGQTTRGFGWLDRAESIARSQTRARLQMRRAYLLRVTGRNDEAKEEIRKALDGIRRANDRVWEARALNSRALIHLAAGDIARAERDAVDAQRLFVQTGQVLESVFALHTRGFIAFSRNSIPQALRLLDEAAAEYRALGSDDPDLAIDRSQVLLSAGLAHEAVEVLQSALAAESMPASTRAEMVLALAEAHGADRNPAASEEAAREAVALFRRQQRAWWQARARLVEYRASFECGVPASRLMRRVALLAETFTDQRSEEACAADLLAGRIYLSAGRQDDARLHLDRARRYRHRGRVETRVTAWFAQALLADMDGDRRGAASACRHGLDRVDELRAGLGSLELRATGAELGADLFALASRQAVERERGRARSMLAWAERWRATALSLPPAGDRAELTRDLVALRATSRTLEEARSAGTLTPALLQAHARQERLVLSRQRQVVSTPSPTSRQSIDLPRLVTSLRDRVLVELLDVDEKLHAVVVKDGRVTSHVVGPSAAALGTAEFARVALRNLSIGPTAPLGRLGHQLQSVLLGSAADLVAGRDVLLVPPARLSSVPWSFLPVLSDTALTVAPSAGLWLRALEQARPADRRVVLVAGPDLRGAEMEVAQLTELYPDATVLRGSEATVDRVLAAIDGAWIVHFASHGTFRQEAPLFSSLRMYDGPLMVHDLQRLRSCPYRFVLSACEAGVSASPGRTDEVLGFGSALVGLGAAGVASAVAEINDLATVQLMIDIHSGLLQGHDLPTSLRNARIRARETVAEVASTCFVSFGS